MYKSERTTVNINDIRKILLIYATLVANISNSLTPEQEVCRYWFNMQVLHGKSVYQNVQYPMSQYSA